MFGELEDRKEPEESSPALLTGIEATEAQRSAARHEKILFNMLYLPLLTDTISNIDKDITLSGISQLSGLSNTQKKRSAAARDRSALASSDAGPELAGRAAFAGIARAAARSPREDQALLLRRRLPLVPRAASPHGGQPCCQPHVAQPTNS